MFYEFYDWDFELEEKEYCLINLDEVLQINRVTRYTEVRNSKSGQISKAYRIKVYYTGHSNEWAFYFRSESERNIIYENLKKAMIEAKKLMKPVDTSSDVSNILDGLKKSTNILEDLLKNPPENLDIPQVSLSK